MINLLVIILIAILVVYAVRLLPIAHTELRNILTIVVAIIAIIVVAQYAGAL